MIDRRLNVAPMMGCTDRHFRYLMRLIAPRAVLYSEMVTSGALIHGGARRFLVHQDDAPCAMQLGGSDPHALAICARMVEDAGYQEVNLNVGCPSDRVQQGGIGACLMADPHLVADCVGAMQSAVTIPVTVKSRIGIDDQDSYECFARFVEILAGAGNQVFIVHARKAILAGLSPKENREIPPLRYDFVYRAKRSFPHLDFVLNGGLAATSPEIERAVTALDGVMLGREAYANPFVIGGLHERLFGQHAPSHLEVFERYQAYVESQLREGVRLKYVARHLLGFFQGRPGARKFRRALSATMFAEDANADVIRDAVDQSGVLLDTSTGTAAGNAPPAPRRAAS